MASALKSMKKILSLSLSLSAVDFKIRNEGAYLGIIWYLLEPLAFFGILLLMQGVLKTGNIENYTIYLFLGLAMFNFFRASTSYCVRAINYSSQFIKSMQVPAEAIIISKVLQAAYAHFFEVAIIFFLVIAMGLNPAGLILYPIAFGLLFLFSLGTAFFIATLGTFSEDFQNVWNITLRVLWFLTPLFYIAPSAGALFWANLLNPLTHLIFLGRLFVMEMHIDFVLLIFCLTMSLVVAIIGWIVFEHFKKNFAEWI